MIAPPPTMSTTAQPQTTSAQNHQTIDSPDLESAQDRAAVIHNEQSVKQNAHIAMPFPGDQTPNSLATFKSTIAAPSPPPNATSTTSSSNLFHLDTSARQLSLDSTSNPSPLSGGLRLNSADLRIQTDIIPAYTVTAASSTVQTAISESAESSSRPIARPGGLTRAPSVKNVFASSIGSNSNSVFGSAPNSALSSPMLSAMADVTPLPSPLLSGDSPGPWKKLGAPLGSRPGSRDAMITADSALVAANGESISSAIANQSKRRAYHGLMQGEGTSGLNNMQALQEKNKEGHTRNRSLSEYVPGSVQIPKRHITVSGSHGAIEDPSVSMEGTMRREPHLAVQRGLAPMPRPPTPPKSTTGGESSDSDSSLSTPNGPRAHRKPRYEYYDAHTRNDSKRRRWRALKCLGTGTFSKVMLATSQSPEEIDRIDEDDVFGPQVPVEAKIDRKKLVAIKICEHGPKGGASEERIEMSLKRELEILKTTRHPSLIHLKAWNIEETRAILVVDYCPGGDLFEVASKHNELLVPALIRRIFAELVGAVRYLHERHIVHRDIKLENVLVNLPPSELAKPTDWTTYPYSVTTLTDLGLARRVADDEMLTTRCGSDDYAAPEVIMGQPYDGRSTDAWCLGVLLYALLESRLPFDPLPGAPEYLKQRSKTTHRIARVEWKWVQFAGEEGDHEGDPKKFESMGLKGAMEITEGFLNRKRSRWPMEKAAEQEWVKGAINVDGGVRYREEHVPDEVP